MKDALTILLILLVVALIIYWFGINREWQLRLRKRLLARKIMRAMKKNLKKILGAIPKFNKDGTRVIVGKQVFTYEEYEQYYITCLKKQGYIETEDGWEKPKKEGTN